MMSGHANLTLGERRQLHVLLRHSIAYHVGKIMRELDKEEMKQLVKDAITSWLDDQFAAFGRWTFYGLVAALLAGVLTIIIWVKGLPLGH